MEDIVKKIEEIQDIRAESGNLFRRPLPFQTHNLLGLCRS